MHIEKIIIENFKGIKKVELGPIRQINVLIGHNNCGKSSILECLDLFCKHLKIEEEIFRNRGSYSGESPSNSLPEAVFNLDNNPISLTVEVILDEDDKKGIIFKSVDEWNNRYSNPKMSSEIAEELIQEGFLSNMVFRFEAKKYKSGFALSEVNTIFTSSSMDYKNKKIIIGQGDIRNSKVNDIRDLLIQGRNDINSRINAFSSFKAEENNDRNESFRRTWLNGIYGDIKNTFKSSFIINPYRHGQSEAVPKFTQDLATDGNNLIQYLHNLALNNYKLFEEISQFVKAVLPEVGRLHPRFTGDDTSQLELAYEWQDGRIVNLANMGGGVEQILILGAMLISQKRAFILLEEPESHLHPGAQEVLLYLIEKYMGDSYIFLTTHSPVFIQDKQTISIHAIKNPDGKDALGTTIAFEDFNEVLTLIGSRPGHLAQADIVLYVEGKWGSVVIEEWLEKWPEKNDVLGSLHLVVQPMNADEIGSNDFDISKFKTVTPNMIVFADKDNDPGQTKPKKSRLDLKEKCSEFKIPFMLTEKRQIEDYFTENAVRIALPSNILNSWEYNESKPMSKQYIWKKYNKRVASEMEWGDILAHKDIMKIFEEIKNIAIKLKPNAIN